MDVNFKLKFTKAQATAMLMFTFHIMWPITDSYFWQSSTNLPRWHDKTSSLNSLLVTSVVKIRSSWKKLKYYLVLSSLKYDTVLLWISNLDYESRRWPSFLTHLNLVDIRYLKIETGLSENKPHVNGLLSVKDKKASLDLDAGVIQIK